MNLVAMFRGNDDQFDWELITRLFDYLVMTISKAFPIDLSSLHNSSFRLSSLSFLAGLASS